MEKMPVLIYMESAYRKSDGSGAVRCEVMLPGDGQTTISKTMRNTTMRALTREKLLLLAELLQNGVPDSNGERRKLRCVEVMLYTSDQAFWEEIRNQADAELLGSSQRSRNSDVCSQIIRQSRENGCRLRNMGNSLLQKLVCSEAYRYPNPAHRPTWYQTQQLVSDGTLLVSADEQPKPFIVNAPSYQWLRSGGWDEDLIVDAEPAVTTKCGRPMSSARASQTVGMMPAYYGEVAEDLLKLVQLRKGEFSAEMQQRLLFYIYVYSVLKISYKRDGDAPAAEAVRAADALMRHPMTPEMLEQRISGLRASARYDRTSVSRNRVISDLQITVAEQKQLKRLLGHEEDLRRKSKSGMLRSERDAALDTAIVEMLAQGKLHREIGEKLGMARESVTRRIRRNNLLREVQEARNALAKEQARAKRAEKTKDKDDDDKNGGAGAGGTQAASKPQKKSSRKPMSESRRLAVLAVQRVRRAKERLARKCSICIRNLAKRYYRLNAARVEWIGSASAAESPCNTPFPQLC